MTTYYFDTSALAKLYVQETGSAYVSNIVNTKNERQRPSHQIAFAKIGLAEVSAAIARRERLEEISQPTRRRLYQQIIQDSYARFRLLNITDSIVYLAASLTQRIALRGYDAVHLATAIELNQRMLQMRRPPIIFVSADDALCQASSAEGLRTENPNNKVEG
jgi:uncharacterized protein